MRYPSYGLKSVDKTDSLNHFKLRMGFTLRPFQDKIVLNPVLGGLLRLGGRHLIETLAQKHPANDVLRKAARVIHIAAEELHA